MSDMIDKIVKDAENSFDYINNLADAELEQDSNKEFNNARATRLDANRKDRYKDLEVDSYGNPVNDGDFFTWAKELVGADVYRDGVKVSSSNKDFSVEGKKTLDDLVQEYYSAEEDPNANGLVYTLKVFDGYNDDGSERYLYKNGYAKVSAWDRYKDQLVGSGAEIVDEKRFVGAEQWEKQFNTLTINDRALDLGRDKNYDGLTNKKTSAIGFGSGYTELRNHDILGVDSNSVNYAANKIASKNKALAYAKAGIGLDDGMLKAFESGVLSTAGKIGDLAVTIGTAGIFTDNWFDKLEKNADKWAGYDRRAMTAATHEATQQFKKGNYWEAVTHDFWTISGEGLANSLPEMMVMSLGWEASAAKLATKAKNLISLDKKILALESAATKTTTTVKELKTLKKIRTGLAEDIGAAGKTGEEIAAMADLSLAQKIYTGVAKEAGFDAVVAGYTNDQIDQRREAGLDTTIPEALAIGASNYLLLALDRFAFKDIMGGEGIAKSISAAFQSATTEGKKAFLAKLGSKAATIAGETAMETGAEGGQEYLQQWGEILATQWGGSKSFDDIINNEKNQDAALGAGIAGGLAGTGMSGIGQVVGGVKKAFREKYNIERPETNLYQHVRTIQDLSNQDIPFADRVYAVSHHIDSDSDHNIEGLTNSNVYENLNKMVEDEISQEKYNTLSEGEKQSLRESTQESAYSSVIGTLVDNVLKNGDKESEAELKKIMADESISDTIKNDSVYKEVTDVLSELDNMYASVESGSDVNKASEDNGDSIETELEGESVKEDESSEEKKPKQVKNKLFGKLDETIERTKKVRDKYKNLGMDVSPLDGAIATLEHYNTAKDYNYDAKRGVDVSNEVSGLGYMFENGKVGLPSIFSYNLYLPKILSSTNSKTDDGFVTFNKFNNFVRGRIRKALAKQVTAQYAMNVFSENIDLGNVVNKLIMQVTNDKGLNDNKKEKLLETLNNQKQMLSDAQNAIVSRFISDNGTEIGTEAISQEELNSMNEAITKAEDMEQLTSAMTVLNGKKMTADQSVEFFKTFTQKRRELFKNGKDGFTPAQRNEQSEGFIFTDEGEVITTEDDGSSGEAFDNFLSSLKNTKDSKQFEAIHEAMLNSDQLTDEQKSKLSKEFEAKAKELGIEFKSPEPTPTIKESKEYKLHKTNISNANSEEALKSIGSIINNSEKISEDEKNKLKEIYKKRLAELRSTTPEVEKSAIFNKYSKQISKVVEKKIGKAFLKKIKNDKNLSEDEKSELLNLYEKAFKDANPEPTTSKLYNTYIKSINNAPNKKAGDALTLSINKNSKLSKDEKELLIKKIKEKFGGKDPEKETIKKSKTYINYSNNIKRITSKKMADAIINGIKNNKNLSEDEKKELLDSIDDKYKKEPEEDPKDPKDPKEPKEPKEEFKKPKESKKPKEVLYDQFDTTDIDDEIEAIDELFTKLNNINDDLKIDDNDPIHKDMFTEDKETKLSDKDKKTLKMINDRIMKEAEDTKKRIESRLKLLRKQEKLENKYAINQSIQYIRKIVNKLRDFVKKTKKMLKKLYKKSILFDKTLKALDAFIDADTIKNSEKDKVVNALNVARDLAIEERKNRLKESTKNQTNKTIKQQVSKIANDAINKNDKHIRSSLKNTVARLYDSAKNRYDKITKALMKDIDRLKRNQVQIEDYKKIMTEKNSSKMQKKIDRLNYEINEFKYKIKKLKEVHSITKSENEFLLNVLKDLEANKDMQTSTLEELIAYTNITDTSDIKTSGEILTEKYKTKLKGFIQVSKKKTLIAKLFNQITNLANDNVRKNVEGLLSRFDNKDKIIKSFKVLSRVVNNIPLYAITKVLREGKMLTSITDDGRLVDKLNTGIYDIMELFSHIDQKSISEDGKNGLMYYDEALIEPIRMGIIGMVSSFESLRSDILNKDKNDIIKDTGMDYDKYQDYITMLYKGYVPAKLLRQEIEGIVSESIALMASKNADMKINEALKKSLIIHVEEQLKSMVIDNKNVITTDKFVFSDNGSKSQEMIMLKMDTKLASKIFGDIKELTDAYREYSYLSESKQAFKPQFKPIKKVDETIRHSDTPNTEEKKNLLRDKQSVPWHFEDNLLSQLEPLYNDESTRQQVLEMFGWKEITDDMTTIEKQEVLAHNMQYERHAEILFRNFNDFKDDETGETVPFFIKHSETKSERNMVDCELNPVDSKIHREFVHTDRYISEIEPTTNNKREIKDIDSNKMTDEEMFELRLNQAFDMDPDKNGKIQVFKDIRELVDIYSDNITVYDVNDFAKALDDFIHSDKLNIVHLATIFHESGGGMHAMKAAMSLRELYLHKQSKTSGKFKTTLTAESDAITSGAILQALQIGSDTVLKLAEKGGIYTKEAYAKWSAYTKYLLAKKHKVSEDEIEFSAGALIEAGKYHINELQSKNLRIGEHIFKEPFLDLYTTVGETAIHYNSEPAEDFTEHEVDTFDSFKEILGELTLKVVRKIAKSPVMVYLYGASVKNIMKKLSETVGESLFQDSLAGKDNGVFADNIIYDYMMSINEKNKEIPKQKLIDMFYNDRKNFIIVDEDQKSGMPTEEQFSKMSLDKKKKSIIPEGKLSDVIKKYNDLIIGNPFRESFSKIFGDFDIYRKGMKVTDVLVATIFESNINKKIAEIKAKNNGKLSVNDVKEIITYFEKNGEGHTIDFGNGKKQPLYKKDKTSKLEGYSFVKINVGTSESYDAIKFINNSGAAPTISIHNIDAMTIMRAIGTKHDLSIYDAIVTGGPQKNMLETGNKYNDTVIPTSLEFGNLKAYVEKLNRMIKDFDINTLHKKLRVIKKNTGSTVSDFTAVSYQLFTSAVVNNKRTYKVFNKKEDKNNKINISMQVANDGSFYNIDYYRNYTKKDGSISKYIDKSVKLTFNSDTGLYNGYIYSKAKTGVVLQLEVNGLDLKDMDIFKAIHNYEQNNVTNAQLSNIHSKTNKFIKTSHVENKTDVSFEDNELTSTMSYIDVGPYSLIDDLIEAIHLITNSMASNMSVGSKFMVNHNHVLGLEPREVIIKENNNTSIEYADLEEKLNQLKSLVLSDIVEYTELTFKDEPSVDLEKLNSFLEAMRNGEFEKLAKYSNFIKDDARIAEHFDILKDKFGFDIDKVGDKYINSIMKGSNKNTTEENNNKNSEDDKYDKIPDEVKNIKGIDKDLLLDYMEDENKGC